MDTEDSIPVQKKHGDRLMMDSTDLELPEGGMDSSGDMLDRSPRSKSPADYLDSTFPEDEEEKGKHRDELDDSLIDFGFDSHPEKPRSRRPSRSSLPPEDHRRASRTPSPTPLDDILAGVPTLPRRGSRSSMGMIPTPGMGGPRGSLARQPTLPVTQDSPTGQRSPVSLSRSSSRRSLVKPPSSDFGQQVSDVELSEDSGSKLLPDPDKLSSDRHSDRSLSDRLVDPHRHDRPDSRHSDRSHRDHRPDRPDSRQSRRSDRPDSRQSKRSPREERRDRSPRQDRRQRSPPPQDKSPQEHRRDPSPRRPERPDKLDRPDSRHSDRSRRSDRDRPDRYDRLDRPDSRHSDREPHSEQVSDIDHLSEPERHSDTDRQSIPSRQSGHSDPDDIDEFPPPPPPHDHHRRHHHDDDDDDERGPLSFGDHGMRSSRV